MNYYRLMETVDLPNALIPEFPSASAIWSETEPMFLAGRARNGKKHINFLSFYRSGILSKVFLVSAETWQIWREFQAGGRCRPCAFGHVKARQVKPYYLVMPKIIDGLHNETVFLRDGNVKTICLSKEAVGTNQVFAVKGSTLMELLVSEDVLEDMLRSGITSFSYEQAETRGE